MGFEDTNAYVKTFIQNEYIAMEEASSAEDREPESTFSVRLPVSDVGRLERIAQYFGEKKTPFAARLLSAAIEDAWAALLMEAEERGRGGEVAEYLSERHELEDGSGWTQTTGFGTGSKA